METFLLAPALLFVGSVIVYPLFRMFQMSFMSYKLTRPWDMGKFVGAAHYARMLSDPNFWGAVRVSVLYTFGVTALAFLIGLLLAMLVNRQLRGIAAFRSVLTLPWAIPSAIAAFTWLFMFQEAFGVINYLLRAVGVISRNVPWLLQPGSALAAVTVVGIWKVYPFNMVVVLAGLQAIPRELYEAAQVDGAGAWQRFWSVTWPGLRYVNTVAILLTAMHALREFEQIYILTEGGPARATETLGLQVYQEAFQFMDFGYASAVGVVVLALSLTLAAVFIRGMSRQG